MDAEGINQFCISLGLSRASFYRLLASGRGPKIIKIGNRTKITTEEKERWLRELVTTGEPIKLPQRVRDTTPLQKKSGG